MTNIDISLLAESDLREAAMTGVIGAHSGLSREAVPTVAEIARITGTTEPWAEQFRAVLLHCYDSVVGTTSSSEGISLEEVIGLLQKLAKSEPAGV